MPTRKEIEDLGSQLTAAERQSFGIDYLLAHRAWLPNSPSARQAWELGRKALERKKSNHEEKPTMPSTAITPQEPQPIIVTSGTLAEFASAIMQSVGAPLHESIAAGIQKADECKTISDGASYTRAGEHRRDLLKLVNDIGDQAEPGRLKVRISLGLVDASGQKVAVACETTVGTKSVSDLYNPLADLLHRMHRATTAGREELASQIQGARSILEKSILAYDDEQRRKKEEEEYRQRLIQQQTDRTQRATHWISQLCEHGYSVEACAGLLQHPLEQVSEDEVATLESLLREKLLAEEKAKQEKELEEAINTAKRLGMQDVAAELEGKAAEPVVAPELPPPPPPPIAPAASVAQLQTPKVKGMGRRMNYLLVIDDPYKIPAMYLLPPDGKLRDPEAYPRLRAKLKSDGEMFKVPGCHGEPESKLTQR